MSDSPERIQWHPAFYAATNLEFREDIEYLERKTEYNLSKQPIRIDLLIIKDDALVHAFIKVMVRTQMQCHQTR